MPAIDDDAIIRIVDQHRHGDGRPNSTTLAAALGIPRSSLQHRLRLLAREGRLGYRAILPGFGIKQVSEQQDETGAIQKTWVKQSPVGEAFEIPPGHAIHGLSTLLDAQGQIAAQWIKTKAEPVEDAKAAWLDAFAEYRGKSELIAPPSACDERLLTVYPIADFHLGMLAWGRETGVNWDLKIAQKTLSDSIAQLISLSPPSKIGVILNLGDFIHADDQTNQTPASGHQLDVDGRFPKIAREAVRLHVAMVELALQKHKRVIVRCLPGNHDPTVSQMITVALGLFFESNPRVAIDEDPSDFFFLRHGQVLIGANHGHRVKPSEMPGVMASYRPKEWGATKWRYCYSGHFHHAANGEKYGATWEIFRTLAAKDAYAHAHGYSSGRTLVGITHHDERGEVMRQTVSV